MYAKSTTTIANILEAAESLFTSKNYADVTMAEIAETAAVTKGALYHHFASKEALYLTMMHNFLEEIGAILSEVVAESAERPCRDRLHQFTLTFLNQPPGKQELMRLVRRDVNILQDPNRQKRFCGMALPTARCWPKMPVCCRGSMWPLWKLCYGRMPQTSSAARSRSPILSLLCFLMAWPVLIEFNGLQRPLPF